MPHTPTSRAKARATRILNLRKVRTYLIANPGVTSAQVREATGYGLSDLQHKGLAFWKRGEDGLAHWWAKPGLAYPNAFKSE